MNLYKLKQIDLYGQVTYSLIERVNFSQQKEVSLIVYPNPASDVINIVSFKGSSYLLSDANGKVLLRGTLQHAKTQIHLPRLSSGIYFIHVGTQVAKVILK